MNLPRIMAKITAPMKMLARLIPLRNALAKYLSYTTVPKTWDPTNPQTIPHIAGLNLVFMNLSLR